TLEQHERCQLSAIGCDLDDHGRTGRRHETLGARHELIDQLRLLPPPRRGDVAPPLEVPRELEQMLFAARQLDHVEYVYRTGPQRAGHRAVAAARPRPLARGIEGLARGVARLGTPTVQPGGVVSARRA